MVTASFKEGQKAVITTSLQKYDYGEVLRIKGLSLPRYVAVQFAVDGMSEALPSSIGETVEDVTDVLIPNSLLRSNIKPWNYNIMAYVYIVSGSSGKTEYTITIPVKWRPKTGDDQAVDDDVASVIGSAVEKMNTATTKAENAANQASATAEEIKTDREKITTNEVEISGLKSDLGDVVQLSENLISLSEESAVIIDNVTPTLEFPNVGSVKITQPSRANVKIAFPINMPDDTDLTSEYAISIKSDVVLNSIARAMIVVDASTSSQGTTIKPVLQQSEDYSTWSATGSFDNVKKKYVYILLPYNIPSATFEISVQKNIDKTIKLSALKNIGDNNFDSKTQKRLKTVDYLEKEVGEDLSEKTLIVLNFEYPAGAGDIFYDARQALLESYGFKGSFALTEELNDNQVTRLHNLVNNGHDISIYNQSTTGRPDDVDDVSKQSEWNKYIKDIIDLANSYGVRNPAGYHCKYNKIGKALYNALLTNGFKVVRCTNGVSAGLIPEETEDSKYIKSFDKIMTVVDTAGMASSSTSGGYIYWIKQCIQNGWDFSLFGHAMEDVDENTAVSDSVNFKKYVYVEILDYIKQCVNDGTVAVVTWKDFYDIRSKA